LADHVHAGAGEFAAQRGFLAVLVGADAGAGKRADARADQRALAALDRVVAGQQAGHGADARADERARAGAVGVVRILGLAGVGGAAGKQDRASEGGAQSGGGKLAHAMSPGRWAVPASDLNARPS